MADPVFRSAYDFLAPSPDANYGSVLPFAYNREGSPSWVQEGSNPRLAMPEWLRSAMQGVVGLGESTQTGSLTPEALATLTMGSVGTGATLGARGALASGASRPIRAYHGSPHSFDRFDVSKIGTGEGTQAYGHGLYFAENEGVAKSYKNVREVPVTFQGKDIDPSALTHTSPAHMAQEAVYQTGSLTEAAKQLRQYRSDPQMVEALAWLEKNKGDFGGVGHMYEVGIHADPARFMQWDKPDNAQAPMVQSLLKTAGIRDADLSSPADTARLAQAGIPGIKYLDHGSRAAGQGSSNYVVFDPSIVEIMRKYGFAVPSPAVPGFSVAQPSQPPTQQPGFRVAKDMVF